MHLPTLDSRTSESSSVDLSGMKDTSKSKTKPRTVVINLSLRFNSVQTLLGLSEHLSFLATVRYQRFNQIRPCYGNSPLINDHASESFYQLRFRCFVRNLE